VDRSTRGDELPACEVVDRLADEGVELVGAPVRGTEHGAFRLCHARKEAAQALIGETNSDEGVDAQKPEGFLLREAAR
jgi:hypothetical protein